MGFLKGLIARLRSLIPGLDSEETTGAVGVPPERAYECAVCGTPIPPDEEQCPLCRSTDLVPAGGPSTTTDADGRLQGEGPEQTVTGDDGVTIGAVLGEDGDLLTAYADRWERRDDGYRVELADGTMRRVESQDELRATLYDQYGPPNPD